MVFNPINTHPVATYSDLSNVDWEKMEKMWAKEKEQQDKEFQQIVSQYQKYTPIGVAPKFWIVDLNWGKLFIKAESKEHVFSILISAYFNKQRIDGFQLEKENIAQLASIEINPLENDYFVEFPEE